MKILITIPTSFEIHQTFYKILKQKYNCELITSGIGMVNTTFTLTKYLQINKVDYIVHGGIAGSFKQNLQIGSVVQVVEDIFADFGINENSNIIHASEIFNEHEWYKNEVFDKINIQKAKGITINNVTACNKTKCFYIKKYNADIETMENAAVFYVCEKLQVPFISIRSVSNYVGDRNKQNWNVQLAVENLWLILKQIIEKLNE